jgi:hypothetical protein
MSLRIAVLVAVLNSRLNHEAILPDKEFFSKWQSASVILFI